VFLSQYVFVSLCASLCVTLSVCLALSVCVLNLLGLFLSPILPWVHNPLSKTLGIKCFSEFRSSQMLE